MILAKKIVNEYRMLHPEGFDNEMFEKYFGEIIHSNPSKIIKNKFHFDKLIKEINMEIKDLEPPKKDGILNCFTYKCNKISAQMYINCHEMEIHDTIQHVFLKKYVKEYCGEKVVNALEDFRYIKYGFSVDVLVGDITNRNETFVFGTEEEIIYHKNSNKKMVTELSDEYRAQIYILHLEDYWTDIRENKKKFLQYILEASKYVKMNGIIIAVIKGLEDSKIDVEWEKVGIYPMFAYTQTYSLSNQGEGEKQSKKYCMNFSYSDMIVFKKGFVQQCCFTKMDEDVTVNEVSIAVEKAIKGDSHKNIFYRDNNKVSDFSYNNNLSLFYKEVAERKKLKEGYSRLGWEDLIISPKSPENAQYKIHQNVFISLAPNLTYDSKVFFKSKEEYENNILIEKGELYLKDFPRNEKWVEYILNNIDDKTKEKIFKINLLETTYEYEEDYWQLCYTDEDTKLGVLLNMFFYVDTLHNNLRKKDARGEKADIIQSFKEYHEYDIEKACFQYRLTDSVLKKFIKDTCVTRLLNDKYIRKDYFFAWLKCNDGREFERECQKIISNNSNMFRGGNYNSLQNLHLTAPDIGMQEVLVSNLKKLDSLKERIESETNRIYDFFNVLPSQSNGNFYLLGRDLLRLKDEIQDFYNLIPQPLSSILYNNYCELEISRKTRNYLHFFESSTAFLAIFLLSISYDVNPKLIKDVMKDAFMYGTIDRETFKCRINFGTWNNIIKRVIKLIENADISDKTIVRSKVKQVKKIYTYICETNQIRNRLSHGGYKTYDDEKKDLMLYETIADNMIRILSSIFEQYEFVYGIKIISAPDGFNDDIRYYGYSMQGYSQRLKIKEYWEIKQLINPDSNKIYIRDRLSNHFYDMLPLIRYQNLIEQDSSLKASYYINEFDILFDKKELGGFGWKSYDSLQDEDVNIFDDGLYELLKDVFFK